MSASTGKSSTLFTPWFLGNLPETDDPNELRAALVDRLRPLEQLVDRMRLAMVYGPVAGSYVPHFFNGYVAAGLAAGIHTVHYTPFNFRPLFASVWVNDATSQLTVQLRYDDGSGAVDILSANWQFTGSDFLNARADFAVDLVPDLSKVYLEIVSVADGGTPVPTNIRAALWGKGCSRIEPT